MSVTPGTVYLVGAGPGDPGLMTVRALEVIAAVDVVLHDRLIPATALQGTRPDAEVVDVGKRGGGEQVPQETTEALILRHAAAGRSVARVKGGDPFVFGRGGEEAATVRAHGIPFEIVSGVSAGIAGPAYAGIPVTHRDHAAAVAFVTGHEDPQKPGPTVDWAGVAAFPGTLVFYMGVKRLPVIARSLIDAGRAASEPAAVIQSGTEPAQRVVTAPLEEIAEVAAEAGIRAPAVTVVGPVAALREELRWFEDRPLFGRRVAVTRARAQASGLARRLRALGAEVLETPTIRTRSLQAELPDLEGFDLLAVTSPNGVRELVTALLGGGRDVRALHALTVAAVGPGTARALREQGIAADVVPETFSGAGLAAALADTPLARALLIRAAAADPALPDALRERGAEVVELALYETTPEPLDAAALEALGTVDYVTFTSASTARFLAEAGGGTLPLRPATRIVSIGPATSAALRELDGAPVVEAAEATLGGLLAALVADATGEQRPTP